MGWRERFGGDDERAQIAARARALLETSGPGPSAGSLASDPWPGPGPAAPSWPAPRIPSIGTATGAPADRLPPPLTVLPPVPPATRRGGWVPELPAVAPTAEPAGGRHAAAGSVSALASARVPAARWPDGLFADDLRGDDVLDAVRARRGAPGGRDPVDGSGDEPGGALRALRDRVRWDPGRRGLVAVAAVVVVAGSVAGGLVVRGGSSAVTLAAASGAAPSAASAAPVVGGGSAGSRAPASPSAPAGTSTPTGTVTVDVAGLVARPGVYTLPAGSRVADALAAAGGAQPGADLTTLNRARVLVDGEQLAVGVPGASPAAATPTGGAGTGGGPAGLVDLNTASADQLDALPGVGPVLAQAIIAWRTDHGRFASVDDLDQVSGIGPATFADLRALVTV